MKCRSCGSAMEYVPGNLGCNCISCGNTEPFQAIADLDPECKPQPATELLSANRQLPLKDAYHCKDCGAHTQVPTHKIICKCPFCGNPISPERKPHTAFDPVVLLPFQITESSARDALESWAASLSEQRAHDEKLPVPLAEEVQQAVFEPVFLPFWVWETHTSPPDIQQLRRAHPSWIIPESHDGNTPLIQSVVPVYNGKSFPSQELHALEPWGAQGLVRYDPVFISNVPVEMAQCGVRLAFEQFQNGLVFSEYWTQLVGGDWNLESVADTLEVNNHHVRWRDVYNPQDLLTRQCLLPAWIGQVNVNGVLHRLYMNGVSGELAWETPHHGMKKDGDDIRRELASKQSWMIAGVILLFIAFFASGLASMKLHSPTPFLLYVAVFVVGGILIQVLSARKKPRQGLGSGTNSPTSDRSARAARLDASS